MHKLEIHTKDTHRRVTVLLDENGGALTDTPSSAVLRVITAEGEGDTADTVVEFDLQSQSARRWYIDFTQEQLESLPESTELACKAIATYDDSSTSVHPTGDEDDDFLYLKVLPTPTAS